MGMVARRYAIAFVGGGLAVSGALRGLLHENATRGDPLNGIDIAVIEPRQRLGVGTAWDVDNRQPLSNMAAATLRVYGALDVSFSSFEIRRKSDLLQTVEGGTFHYVSRSIVGERLAEFYREIEPVAARAFIRVRHLCSSATDIVPIPGGFRIALADGSTVDADCVVLALGLLSVDRYPHLGGSPGYYPDPWAPGDFLSLAGDGERIGIVGLGPSAIDLALQLGERDLRHPVLMCSPSGRLPAVRPRSLLGERHGVVDGPLLREYGTARPFTPHEIDFIIYNILERFGVTLADLHAYGALFHGGSRELLERTLATSDDPQPLFEALKTLDLLAPTIWRWSGEPGRAHIMKKWAKVHALLSYAIPPSNAAALLAQVNSGGLTVRGGLKSVSASRNSFLLEFAGRRTERVDILVNATGFEGSLRHANNPLVRSLTASGLLCEAPYGGASMDYETGRVLTASGRRVDGLFIAGGSLTRTAGYVVNSLLRTTEHGIKVGIACARYLQARAQGPVRPGQSAEEWTFVI